MTDNEEGEETAKQGAEWEVVSLTASTYTADLGPDGVEIENKDKGSDNDKESYWTDAEAEAETSRALFISRHFGFPPSQHESEYSENKDVEDGKDVASESRVDKSEKKKCKDLNLSEEFLDMEFLDDKVKGVSASGKDLEESKILPELNPSEKERSIYGTAAFDSFHNETGLHAASAYGDDLDVSELDEPSDQGMDADLSLSPRLNEDGKDDGSNLPCEAWWKSGAASLYNQAKEANAFWSIFVAAAVVGLVLIGRHWATRKAAGFAN